MPTKTNPKTPEGRADDLRRAASKAKKKYKTRVTTRRKFDYAGEEDLVKDMIIVLKLANYTHSQIAMIVGCSRGQVKTYLQEEKVQKKFMTLKERLPQAAFDLGQAYLIEAVQAIVHVMRTESNWKAVLESAAELLDRFGIPKTSRQEKKTEETSPLNAIGRGGHEEILHKIQQASPEVQEKAALLFDALEDGLKGLVKDATDTEGVKDE